MEAQKGGVQLELTGLKYGIIVPPRTINDPRDTAEVNINTTLDSRPCEQMGK